MSRSSALSILRWLVLLVQLSAPVGASIADAQALGSSSRTAHFEEEDCDPSHPLDCDLCSFLRAPAAVGGAPSFIPGQVLRHERTLSLDADRRNSVASLAELPRGPPTSS